VNLDSASDGWTREILETSIVTQEQLIAEDRALVRRQRCFILLAVFLTPANALLGWHGLGNWWVSRNAWEGTWATLDLLSGAWLAYIALIKGVPLYLKTLSHMRRSQAYMQWLRALLARDDS
jgi:hypothetical protein